MIEWINPEKAGILTFEFKQSVGIRTRQILMPSRYLSLHRFARVSLLCQRKLNRAKEYFLGGMGMTAVEMEFRGITKLSWRSVAFNVTLTQCITLRDTFPCVERSLCWEVYADKPEAISKWSIEILEISISGINHISCSDFDSCHLFSTLC